jgi:hypothetical protein
MPKQKERLYRKQARGMLHKGLLSKLPGESNERAQDRFVYGKMRRVDHWKPRGHRM